MSTIEDVNPDKIYVENVRSILHVSNFTAKVICEMAVRDGFFAKKIGLLCPEHGNIIGEYAELREIPDQLECDICEQEDRPYIYQTRDLEKLEYFKLIR